MWYIGAMATTKKTSKAKIKTTKKTATKVTSAAKTTKKSTTAKVVKAPVIVKKAATKISISTLLLNRLNLVSAALALIGAAAAGLLMNSTSYQLFTSLLARDELASKAHTVFAPAIHAVYDIELRWAVVAILLLSGVVPLLAATRGRKQYELSLGKKVMAWRWIDAAIVGALMVEVAALISGVQDIMTLKLVGALTVLAGILAWVAEKQHAETGKSAKAVYILCGVAAVAPWVLIAAYAIGTPVYGMVRSPWYVYALYGSVLASLLGYGINLMSHLKSTQNNYEATERNYLQLNIFARVAFALILIIGLKK